MVRLEMSTLFSFLIRGFFFFFFVLRTKDAFDQHVYMERWQRLPGGGKGPFLALRRRHPPLDPRYVGKTHSACDGIPPCVRIVLGLSRAYV